MDIGPIIIGFTLLLLMLGVILLPLSIFLGLSVDVKNISRDIQVIKGFIENPPPLEMRTNLSDVIGFKEKKPPYTGSENYL